MGWEGIEEVVDHKSISLTEKEEFDWGKYLMEGEELDFGPDVETPVIKTAALLNKLRAFSPLWS